MAHTNRGHNLLPEQTGHTNTMPHNFNKWKLRSQLLEEIQNENFCNRNCDKIFHIINQGLNINNRICETGETVLHKAAYYNRRALAKRLLFKGANVNVKDNKGNTPLHHACSRNHHKMASFLINFGATVNAKNNYDGYTPLHTACLYGSTETADVLIKRGANVNIGSSCGDTPLHVACECEAECDKLHIILINILIENGADVNAQNRCLNTPLHYASYCYGTAEKIAILLAHGASVTLRNSRGETPYDRCTEYYLLLDKETGKQLLSEFLKHKTKMQVANLPFYNDLDKEYYEEFGTKLFGPEEYQEVQVKCEEELKKLETLEFAPGCSLSALFKNAKNPTPLTQEKYQSLYKFLYSPTLLEELPLYGYILQNLFRRSKLVTQTYLSFCCERRQEWCRYLPRLVIERILEYLSDDDMKNFIKSERENSS